MSNYRQEIEKAVQSDNAPNALKELALQLSDKGMKREEIYNIFYEKFLEYQEKDLIREEDLVGDILDMLTGYYVGQNLDLP